MDKLVKLGKRGGREKAERRDDRKSRVERGRLARAALFAYFFIPRGANFVKSPPQDFVKKNGICPKRASSTLRTANAATINKRKKEKIIESINNFRIKF